MDPKEEKDPAVSSFYQFSLLMWKVFLLRKRHYIVTFLEIVLAIVIISIPVIILQSTYSGSAAHYEENEHDRKSISSKNSTIFPAVSPYDGPGYLPSNIHFIFTPNTTVGRSLMMNALELWENKTASRRIINVTGVRNEEDLEEKSLEIQSKWDTYGNTLIGIVFNNLLIDLPIDLPNSLHYKIRYCDFMFHTSSKYPLFRVGPSYSNDYIESNFLAIQAAIENAFINLKGGSESKIQVLMRRFPYPQYEDQSNTMSGIDLAGMVLCYGLFPFIISIVKRVVEEKANRSKELLKMMGMTDFVYWSGTFTSNFIVAFIICLVSTILYCTPFNPGVSLLKHTDPTLCFVLLLLITASSILFCFAISTLFNRPIFAVIVVIMIWVISNNLISLMLFYVNNKYFLLNISSKLAICLIPTGSLVVVYRMLSSMEAMGVGAQWSNMGKFMISQDINLAMVMAMMLLSCFIFSVLIWYIDAVCPWQYGIPKPFYFPFTKAYWFGYKKTEFEDDTITENPFVDYFEEEPTGISPGVVINHVSKVFRTGLTTKAAVDDISLKIYNGQITALLGHNGAGKTTTINVLTGLYRPTNGSATIDGWNILTHTRNARCNMGICAQHNILYDTLTVEEHLKLYAGMKGIKWKDLNKETSDILELLQLSEKKKELSKNLSGGMKRKLSLGIAIIGGSKVLFLDEPTSGLDPEARRSIWDMLLSIRESKTIVLTTHYMEEADILGERIAIMADGKIRCCGSPLFLKKKFGTGYQFHFVKSPECDLNMVTAVLQKHVPGTSLESIMEKDVTYSLAGNMIASFGKMFEELENQKDSLGICSFGLSVTTMEDVFLRVTTMAEGNLIRPGENGTTTDNDTSLLLEGDALFKYTKQTGVALLFQQIRGLLMKRFHHAKRHWGALFPKLIIPLLMMTLLSWILETQSSFTNIVEKPLKINLKSIYGSSKGFYFNDNVTKSFATKYVKNVLTSAGVDSPFVPDPIKYILDIGEKDILGYITDYLVGGSSELSQNNYTILTAWYNGEPYHTSPASLNIMNTAVLRYVTNSSDASFQLTNSPLPSIQRVIQSSFSPESVKSVVSSFMPIILAFLASSYVIVAIHENVSRAKLLQLMSGVSALVYWSSMLLWDLLTHFLCCIILLIPFGIFNGHVFFGHSEAIGTVLLIFLLFGWCSIPLSYLASFLFKKPATGFSLLVTFYVLSGLIPSIIFSLAFGSLDTESKLAKKIDIAMWFMRLFPSFSVTWGLGNLFDISFANAFCDDIPENILTYVCQDKNRGRKIMECCRDEQGNRFLNMRYPITWESDACGREITFMFIDGILFLTILFFCESSIPTDISRFIANFWNGRNTIFVQPASVNSFADSDVLNEVQYVEMLDPSIGNENALLAVGLTKYYKNMCAVDNLTFSVHLEECFGLLGINGAGKTSTFKMLVGDIQPTKGNAFIKSSSLQHNLKKFQSYVGYCPQYDALIDRLTGREMLTLFARLRGIPEAKINDCVSKFITTVDLQDHSEKKTAVYSGGNKRKLSLALAVIGYPPVILLDEPTSGVDPASRRKIWNILSLVRSATGSSVILTTHSMEESEALCNRLAIMVSGQFRCLGSIQELKRKFAQGYTVIAKLKKEQIIVDPLMANAKTLIEKSIPSASLKDGHQGMLHYHVCDTSMPWSRLFYTMEELKEALQLEDYLISDTTLEQIFLAFARSQRLSSELQGAV